MLGLKAKGDVQAAVAEAESAVRRAFGLDGKLALGLPLEQVLFLACRGEKPTPELLTALSELFRAWADSLSADGRTEDATRAREKAAALITLSGQPQKR